MDAAAEQPEKLLRVTLTQSIFYTVDKNDYRFVPEGTSGIVIGSFATTDVLVSWDIAMCEMGNDIQVDSRYEVPVPHRFLKLEAGTCRHCGKPLDPAARE